MRTNFFKRFGIEINIDEAAKHFVNRIDNMVFNSIYTYQTISDDERIIITRRIANDIGQEYQNHINPKRLYGNNYYACLIAVESFYEWSINSNISYIPELIDSAVQKALSLSETDLGIEWRNGIFVRKGAAILDTQLINDPLEWLDDKIYESVRAPFEKSLRHFLESDRRPELDADSITDAYESLEALAKVMLKNDRDLSSNKEIFLSKLNVSTEFRNLLHEYISFANNFRHASTKKPKPELSHVEAESFIYLTGMFIRLAIQQFPKGKTA